MSIRRWDTHTSGNITRETIMRATELSQCLPAEEAKDSGAGGLLSGWLHTAELSPLLGRFRYPCESLCHGFV